MVEFFPALASPIPRRLDHLTIREFSRMFTLFIRIRMFGMVLMGFIVTAVLIYDPEPWKVGLSLFAAAVLLVTSIQDRHLLRDQQISPVKIAQLLSSALVAHLTIITLSGGIHSPFVVVLPAMSFMVGLGAGRVRPVAVVTIGVIVAVWILAADDFVGAAPRLIPEHFAERLPALGGPAFAITMATLLSFLQVVTAMFGLMARGVSERAVAFAHEAQAETLATMRDRNRELWSLSGAVAHELKNPLASVRGLGSLLARRVEPGTKEAERMGVLLEEVERMGSIIDEFLNFSRPLTAMTRRPTDPSVLVDKVIALHQPLAQDHDITLDAHTQTRSPLSCDPRKITQVLVNLLHNAIEASPRGGTVRLAAEDDGDAVSFTVSDEGSGLQPEVRERLFRPGTTTKPQGSGIGLTVARAICEQHGGTLTLDDDPHGGGCRAILRLPYRGQEQDHTHNQPGSPDEAPPETSPEQSHESSS